MVSKKKFLIVVAGFSLIFARGIFAEEIRTNSIFMPSPPSWINESRVDHVVEKIQAKLEWDIRKITVMFYTDPITFQKLHAFGESVLAFSKKDTLTIAMGPRVNTTNFDTIFGHELVHIILYQKYKTAIPGWLDEGLANYVGQNSRVDYQWLATQKHPDVRTMGHPFKSAVQSSRYQYMASQAVIEMLDSKCGLDDLLQLSVGSNLEHYLSSFCGIDDINQSFELWLKSKNHNSPPANH